MDEKDIKQTQDREFFRVDDEAQFNYFVIPDNIDPKNLSAEEIEKQLCGQQGQSQFKLMNTLTQIDNNAKILFTDITRKYPDIADYMQVMNQKFDVVTKHLLDADTQSLEKINISVGGLAIQCAEAIDVGKKLKVKLVLHPSLYGFICTAQVVSIRRLPRLDQDKPNRISMKFLDLSDNDEKVLNKHILQKQTERN